MNAELDIASRIGFQDARDYLKSHGWQPRPSRRDYVAIFSSPRGNAEVLIPLERDLADYAEAMRRAAATVAELEERSPAQVLNDLLQPRTDTLRFGLEGPLYQAGVVGLDHGSRLVAGARKALLASACAAIRPRRFHPRMSLQEAQEFVGACALGQTEIGSFVLTVVAPLDVGSQLSPQEPLGRRASEHLMAATGALVSAIRREELGPIVDASDDDALVSSNFCSAIVDMLPENEGADLRIRSSWAPILPARTHVPHSVRIEREMYETIASVADRLRPRAGPQADWFIGTVAELAGMQGASGQVEGDVILSLFHEDQVLRANAVLGHVDYMQALQAHAEQKIVIFRGVLHRSPRSNRVAEVVEFATAKG